MPRLEKVLAMARVMLRSFNFDVSFASSRKKESRRRSALFMILFLAVCFMPLALGGGFLIIRTYDMLSRAGMEALIIQGFTSIAAMVIFVFGLANVMAVFYYSGDTERFLTYPVKSGEILAARFLTAVVYEYVICLLAVLPIYCIYGVKGGEGPVYYLYGILICALLPVIPIALAAVPVMLLMRFTRIFRNRDAVNMVFMIVLLALILFFQFSFTNLMTLAGSEQQMIQALVDRLRSVAGGMGSVFVGTGFASAALVESGTLAGLGNLAAFVACTLAVFAVFLLLGRFLYIGGVLGLSQTPAGGKTTLAQVGKMARSGRGWASIMRKDLRIMLRTPVFFLNNIFMIFFLPVFLTIIFTMQGVVNDPDMVALKAALEGLTFSLGSAWSSMTIFGAMAAGALMGCMNSISGSALSREGSNFNVMKVIPVPYRTQIASKTALGYASSLVSGCLTMAIVIGFLKIPPLFAALMIPALALGALFPNLAGILVELYAPKLNWENEQMAVKQNLNVLVEILAGFALAGASIGGGLALTRQAGLLPLPSLAVCVAAAGVLNYALFLIVRISIPRQMRIHYV